MTTVYQTRGTCSRQIDLTIEDGIIKMSLSMVDATVIYRGFPSGYRAKGGGCSKNAERRKLQRKRDFHVLINYQKRSRLLFQK